MLLVHVFAAGHGKTKQYGLTWNMGARDAALPPLGPVAGRLVRTQASFLETLPIALIGVVVAARTSPWTALGGWTWPGARIVYLPLYGFGVPVLRSVAFGASLVGLLAVLWPLLAG